MYLNVSSFVFNHFLQFLKSKSLGGWLFAQVCEALNLNEVDYFGLKYFDSNGTGVSNHLDYQC